MNLGKLQELEPVFYPRSIAIIGASKRQGTMSYFWVENLLNVGFEGRVYPVNRDGSEILGLKAYPDLGSIPEPVDYVIISTPSEFVLPSLDDCAAKGVKVVHVFSAGFGESGTEAGRLAERQLVEKARRGKLRIIGPNCIGVYCQLNKMPLFNASPLGEAGSIGFVSQSGGHAERIFDTGLQRGIHFNKIVSLGNSCDLNILDFMEYFAADPGVKIIAAYIEGVRDGRRFFELCGDIAKTKPTLIWKGGTSSAGAKAVTSHTGSLAGSDVVWSAAMSQVDLISAGSLEELADTLLAFQNLPAFSGRRIAIVAVTAGSGGVSVSASDSCSNLGLEVASLSEETRSQLHTFVSSVGHILENPLDVAYASTKADDLRRILELVATDPNVDIILVYENIYSGLKYFGKEAIIASNNIFAQFSKDCRKPFVLVSHPTFNSAQSSSIEAELIQAGVCVYPTIERAAKAIFNLTRYWRSRPFFEQP